MTENRIAELRKQKKLTQNDLAQKLNITRSSLSLYELGKRDPDTDTLRKFADFFDCSIDYLIGHTNIRKLANDHPVTSAFHVEGDEALSDEDIEAVRSIVKQLVEKNKTK